MSESSEYPAIRKHEREEGIKKLDHITPERRRVAKIFKTYVEKAIDELGPGYTVDLQGSFFDTPIRITIEISSVKREI
jgi:hypothetical protein